MLQLELTDANRSTVVSAAQAQIERSKDMLEDVGDPDINSECGGRTYCMTGLDSYVQASKRRLMSLTSLSFVCGLLLAVQERSYCMAAMSSTITLQRAG
jgi:hypothetical protein